MYLSHYRSRANIYRDIFEQRPVSLLKQNTMCPKHWQVRNIRKSVNPLVSQDRRATGISCQWPIPDPWFKGARLKMLHTTFTKGFHSNKHLCKCVIELYWSRWRITRTSGRCYDSNTLPVLKCDVDYDSLKKPKKSDHACKSGIMMVKFWCKY